MQAPLPVGTTLQDRYRVIQLLGQGGFGRTYLVEDQNRYNERCAVKEFVPQQGEDHFSSKATELFQREANILYQIEHPQIPQFRATFETDQRLFLVQDYVEGPSYRELIYERRSQNSTFYEAEVRQFLQRMLPVLAHIHAKGIIHRDISPDNILLRNRDRLPVLIDFGVVKEVVTRMMDAPQHVTTVGKPGYAPSEQMQSGRAYPSSDLYALAVTAIVLLTGKEPQDLFNDVNLTWNWQQYVTVSPSLAQVLDKAVSYRPGDRYQSVSEMAQALGAAPNATAPAYAPPAAPPSQMRTVAVGRPYQPTAVKTAPAQTVSAQTTRSTGTSVLEDEGSIWENPLAVGALAFGLAVIAGLGGWGFVTALNQNSRREAPVTSEPPTLTLDPDEAAEPPTPTPAAPTATPAPTESEPVTYDQNLALRADESTTVEGSLQANETVNYQLEGRVGQTLTAQLEADNVLMTVLAPTGNPADGQARQVLNWDGELDFTGPYVIQLTPADGEEGNYALQVGLSEPQEAEAPDEASDTEPNEAAAPDSPEDTDESEAPAPAPAPAENNDDPGAPADSEDQAETEEEPQARVVEQRVRFPAGRDSITVAQGVGPGQVKRYIINLREGQTLEAELTSGLGPVSFSILLPTGDPLTRSQPGLWEGNVPVGGDYAIDVVATEQSQFTLLIGAR